MELKLCLLFAKINTAGEPVISDALAASRARLTLILNSGLGLLLLLRGLGGGFACLTS